MKIIKFEKSDVDILKDVLKGLFPEYADVMVETTISGITVVFCKKANAFKLALFPKDYQIKKSLFELLWKEIPLRLSFRKAGNGTFTYMYSLGIQATMMEDPAYLAKYLGRKFKEIHIPYKKDFEMFLGDVEHLEQLSQTSLSTDKLFSTIEVVLDKKPELSNLIRFFET